MREVLAELMRLSEPATTTILLIELLPLNRLLPEDLPEEPLKPNPPSFKVGFEALNIVLGLWIVRRLEAVLRVWRELDLKVLLELIRLGDFAALGFVRGLMDLEGAETLLRTLPTLEARLALGPDELLVTCRDFWLPRLEPALLLRAFFAKRGSANSITAATRVIKAILILFWYLGRSIICLLILQVVSVNSPACWYLPWLRNACRRIPTAPTNNSSCPNSAEATLLEASLPLIKGPNLRPSNTKSALKLLVSCSKEVCFCGKILVRFTERCL